MPAMDEIIRSDGVRLAAHVATPSTPGPGSGLVLCHGFPNGPRGAASVGTTYPDLADRIAHETGWVVLTFNFRGTGTSEGDFSVEGWLADLRGAVRVLASRGDVRAVWTVGFGHGGTFAVCEAPDDELVRGVAAVATPVTLGDWAREPSRLLATSREMGMIRTPDFPPDVVSWGRELAALDAVVAARKLGDRPLLVLHGADDSDVPLDEARALVEAGGERAELCVVQGAGHRLRHDPRAIATLLGWLDRQLL